MELVPTGSLAELDRYIGSGEPASHEALDADEALQQELRNAARTLVAVLAERKGRLAVPVAKLTQPREK